MKLGRAHIEALMAARWPLWAQGLVAVAVIAASLAVRQALPPVFVHRLPLITIWPAMIVLAFVVRTRVFVAASAAGVAVNLGLLGTDRVGVGGPALTGLDAALALGLAGLAVSGLALSVYLARRGFAARAEAESRLAAHAADLERRVAERTRELEVAHAQAAAAGRLASLGTLAAGLGHDVGNLVMPMRLRLDAMARECDARAAPDIAALRAGLAYVQRLAVSLRTLADDGAPTESRTDLRAWWESVEPLMRAALPPSVTLRAELPAAGEAVVAAMRPVALTQAAFNLVHNAGEAVTGSAGRAARTHGVTVEIGRAEEGAFVRVRDDGPGLSAEAMRRWGEPLFSTKGGAGPRGAGPRGMGLSLVRSLVAEAGGRVSVASEPGAGASFTLELPLAGEGPEDRGSVAALVSVPERSTAAFVRWAIGSVLPAAAVREGVGPPEGPGLWVVGAERAAEAERYAASEGQWSLVLADRPPGAGDGPARVVYGGVRPGPAALREVARRVARGDAAAVEPAR